MASSSASLLVTLCGAVVSAHNKERDEKLRSLCDGKDSTTPSSLLSKQEAVAALENAEQHTLVDEDPFECKCLPRRGPLSTLPDCNLLEALLLTPDCSDEKMKKRREELVAAAAAARAEVPTSIPYFGCSQDLLVFAKLFVPHFLDSTNTSDAAAATRTATAAEPLQSQVDAKLQIIRSSITYMDALLGRFLLCRDLDVESATVRFLHFRRLVIEHELVFAWDDDVQEGLGVGLFHATPLPFVHDNEVNSPTTTATTSINAAEQVKTQQEESEEAKEDRQLTASDITAPNLSKEERSALFHTWLTQHGVANVRRPLLTVTPRRLNWEKPRMLKCMKKAFFYTIMNVTALSLGAQTRGILLCNSAKDIGYANMKLEFQKFIAGAVQVCMPMRLCAGFICNQPFLFGAVMWPLMKNLLSKKVRSRMNIIGTDYKPLLDYVGNPDVIIDEAGGKRHSVVTNVSVIIHRSTLHDLSKACHHHSEGEQEEEEEEEEEEKEKEGEEQSKKEKKKKKKDVDESHNLCVKLHPLDDKNWCRRLTINFE